MTEMNLKLKALKDAIVDRGEEVGLDKALEDIVAQARLNLLSDTISVFTYDSDRETFFCLTVQCDDPRLKDAIAISIFHIKDNPFLRDAVEGRSVVYATDVSSDSRVTRNILIAFDCKSILFAPLIMGERIIGGLAASWTYGLHEFSPQEIRGIQLIANQAALTIQNSRLQTDLKKYAAGLSALLELSTTIYSSLNYRTVLEKVITFSKELAGADGCTIYILDKEKGILNPMMTNNEEYAEEIMGYSLRLGEGLSGRVAIAGVGAISNHAATDPEVAQIPGTPVLDESLLAVPLLWSDEVIGVITLTSVGNKVFDKEDLNLLTIFARQAADAIQNAKLFESLEAAYKELGETQEQMVQNERLRALGEMAGGVAHDFNNILGAVLGRVQLVLKMEMSDKMRAGLKIIEQVALDGADTVRRIQEFTRVHRSKALQRVDINQVVCDVAEMTKPKWKDEVQKRGIYIEMDIRLGDAKPIAGLPAELKEAISNMVLNAVDALSEGGKITLQTESDNEFTYIRVMDNGKGMNEEIRKKIFYPFFSTKGVRGTGLGMSVAYGIISRHKGEILVESEENKGSVFTIRLPINLEATEKEKTEFLKKVSQKFRILVVDDDDNIRDVLKDLLTLEGHRTTLAKNGEQAIQLFDKDKFDMIITDLGMPGLSGWDVAKQVKKLAPDIPIIIISGWGAQLSEEELKQAKVDMILAKPFNLEQIQKVIAKCADRIIKRSKLVVKQDKAPTQ